MTQKSADLLDILKWVINILILVVGFFVTTKLNAVDQLETRLRSVEMYQAGAIERDIQQIQKLDMVLGVLNDKDMEIAKLQQSIYDLVISNPELKLSKTP